MQSATFDGQRPPLRLLHIAAGVLVSLLLLAAAVVVMQLREAALADEQRDLANLSLTLAEQADRSFHSVDLVVSSTIDELRRDGVVDAESFIQKTSSYDFYQLLREKMTGIPQLDAVVVENSGGKVINFSRYWPIPEINNGDREYFQALRDHPELKLYISRPVANRGSGSWTIFLARRVDGAGGEFIGVVLGAIQLRYFEDFYGAIIPRDDSTLALQRLDGVMLARFPVTDAIGKTFSSAEHLLQGGTAGAVIEASPIDGKKRLKAAHRVANFPVIALATEAEDTALSSWRRVAWLIGLGVVGCALSIGVATFALGRQWKQHAALANAQAELKRKEDVALAFEEMRAAKEHAEMADIAKSEFLANMSHELRTPLNAILGFSEVMLDERFGPLGSERYRDYIGDIHDSGSHLLEIINDILDLSKAASGKLELHPEWFDVRAVVEAACHLMRLRAERDALSLSVNLPDADLSMYGDERMVKQMLLNLLSNACKFTPAGGALSCTVTVDVATISFVVSDTGVGIAAQDIERVLQPFVQVEGSVNRQHEGTGLGLSLVKMMAELHGGSLQLDSALGQGTIATVMLRRIADGNSGLVRGETEAAPVSASATAC
ncbi:MAG TPA: ATP-binding protein [Stellaceae bacterium]|nr:ATP-binding protein [Stellaceae bacterium]